MRHVFGVLTHTTNPYLTTPVQGYLEVWETTTLGTVNQAVFRVVPGDGTIKAPVEIGQYGFLLDTKVQPTRADAEALRVALGTKRINVAQMDIRREAS